MSKNAVTDVNETKIDREPLPVPTVGIFDEPYYGKKINAQWWQHVSGMIAGLTEHSAWQGTPAEIQTAIAEISALLNRDYEIMDCEKVNDCLPVTDAFTAVQLAIQNQTMQSAQNANAARKKVYLNSGNSKTAVNSLAKNYASKNEQASINILCVAIDHFVRDYVARMIDAAGLARNIGYVANALTQFATTVAGAFEPLLGVAGGAVLYLIDYATDELDEILLAFNDTAAVNEVICCMQDYMHLRANNYANYQSMLASNCYAVDSYAEKIAYYINLHCSNDSIWLYWLDLLATTELCTITADCDCIAPDNCTGITQNYYPASPAYYTIPSSSIVMSSNTTVTTANFGYNTYLMSQGSWLEIELPSPQCINRIMYTCREGASGTGTVSFNFSVNGVVTGTGIDAAGVSGATENQNKSIYNAGSGSELGTLLRIEYPASTFTRQIQITNIRIGYLT